MSSAANITRILLLVVLASSAYAVTDCIDINVSGSYVLENSITNTDALVCINITVSNVSLDGAGFTVDGTDAARSMGIYAYNSSQALTNITIGNITVTDFANGIELRTVQNSSVLDSTVASNVNSGIEANYSVGITLSGVHAENNSASGTFVGGIHFNSVNSSSIVNSRWLGNGKYGILVYPSYDINVTNNTAMNIGLACISIWVVDRGTISYNNISNCSWQGLDLYQLSNHSVFGNNVTGAVLGGIAISTGSRSNLIHDNIIINSVRYGFWDSGSTANTFENNTAHNITGSCFASGQPRNTLETYRNNLAYNCTLYGFNVTNVTNSVYENNIAYGNGNSITTSGFYLGRASSNITLLNNTAYNNNAYGIYLISSGHNVTGNTAYNNSGSGIRLSGSENNTVDRNTAYQHYEGEGIDLLYSNYTNVTNNFVYNAYGGIYLQGAYNNTLINNTAHNNSYPGFPSMGFGIYTNSNYNTLINNTAYNNTGYGFYLNAVSNNTLAGNTAYNNSGYGFYLNAGLNNTLMGSIAYGNTNYSVLLESDSVDNILTNTFIYDQSYYISQQATAASSNNFTNVTLGYNSSIGWLNYQLLNVTALDLNSTNLKLDPYFVSLNDSEAVEANLSANITIYTGSCAYSIFRKPGFQLSRGDITVNGSVYSPLSTSCSDNVLIFDVGGFSGYSAGSECVNISDPTSWHGMINSSGVLYVNANTTLCRDTYYMNAAGGAAALQMNSSGIALNCNQSVIDGINADGYGVYMTGKENNTVENCTVRNFQHGVYMTGTVRYNRLAFNTAFNNSQNGIYMITNVNYNTFINNTAINNTLRGFYIRTSNGNSLINNTAINSGYGFALSQQTAYNNSFTGNTARDNANIGFYLFASSNNTFIGNSAYNNSQQGFYLQSASENNTLLYNVVLNNSLDGIFLDGSNYNTVVGNNITNHNASGYAQVRITANYNNITSNLMDIGYRGVWCDYCNSTNVVGNTINRSDQEALRFDSGSTTTIDINNANITGNYVDNAGDNCIQYGTAADGIMAHNRFFNCNNGIHLRSGSRNNIVMNNTVANMVLFGMDVQGVYNNTITSNNFTNYSSVPIDTTTWTPVDGESFCDNIIVGNTGDLGLPINYTNETGTYSGGTYAQFGLCGAPGSVVENITIQGGSTPNALFDIQRSDGTVVRNIVMTNVHYNDLRLSDNCVVDNVSVTNAFEGLGLIVRAYNNSVSNLSVSNATFTGIYLADSNNNSFRDVEIGGDFTEYGGIYMYQLFSGNETSNNTFGNVTVYSGPTFVLTYIETYVSPTIHDNFFNGFRACKDDPSTNLAGCIEFDHLNISDANLTNNTNIMLADDFVSINSSDGNASQFNSSANITLTADCSPGIIYNIYRKEEFSSSAADIVANGTLYTPTRMACANDYFTFGVTSFSGYALDEGTLNLTIYPSTDVLPHVPTNASCDSSNPSVMLELYRNDVLVANGTSHIEDAGNLTAGTYNYVCNTTNYSSAYATGTLRVRAANTGGSSSPMSISISGDEVVGSTLTIMVRDGSTPVDGAEVRVLYWSGGILNAINLGNTNSDGEVEFTPTFAGEYRVEATESGYGSVDMEFTVEAAEEGAETPVAEEEEAAGTGPAEEETGTEPSGGETSGSTGGQPVGAETPVETAPECIVDSDCGAGFGCEGGACVETAGQPAAEGEETPAVGATPVQQGVPWWAWLIILIVLGAGAYWYWKTKK